MAYPTRNPFENRPLGDPTAAPEVPRINAALMNALQAWGVDEVDFHLLDTVEVHGGQVRVICTAATRPATPPTGLVIYEADTGREYLNEGDATTPIWADRQSSKLTASDLVGDYVASGFDPALPGTATLDLSTPAGVAYVSGIRTTGALESHTYTVSQDTYVDLSSTGAYIYTAVANGAAAPAIASGSIRLFSVLTDTSQITAVNGLGDTLPSVSGGYPVVVTASTERPTRPSTGLHIYETDTGLRFFNAGTPEAPDWQPWGGGSDGEASAMFAKRITEPQYSTLLEGEGRIPVPDPVSFTLNIPKTVALFAGKVMEFEAFSRTFPENTFTAIAIDAEGVMTFPSAPINEGLPAPDGYLSTWLYEVHTGASGIIDVVNYSYLSTWFYFTPRPPSGNSPGVGYPVAIEFPESDVAFPNRKALVISPSAENGLAKLWVNHGTTYEHDFRELLSPPDVASLTNSATQALAAGEQADTALSVDTVYAKTADSILVQGGYFLVQSDSLCKITATARVQIATGTDTSGLSLVLYLEASGERFLIDEAVFQSASVTSSLLSGSAMIAATGGTNRNVFLRIEHSGGPASGQPFSIVGGVESLRFEANRIGPLDFT